jgi:hypothetical protein
MSHARSAALNHGRYPALRALGQVFRKQRSALERGAPDISRLRPDISILLRFASEAVSVRAYLLDVHVAFRMDLAK